MNDCKTCKLACCPKNKPIKETGDPYPYGKQDVEPIEDNEVDFETEEEEDIRIVRARLKRMQDGPGP